MKKIIRKKIFFLVKYVIICLIAITCILTAVYYFGYYRNRDSKYTDAANFAKKVFIKKENGRYTLYKNGQPFIVKGASGFTYIAELAKCGGNTITIWDTSRLQTTLDEAQKYNVSVLIGLDLPGGNYPDFYKNEKKTDSLFLAYKMIVNRYKNHPALLAWSLGNEIEMPLTLTTSAFFKSYKRFLQMIHTDDPDHPVTTAIINYQKGSILNICLRIRDLDFISINTYNRIKEIEQQLAKMKLLWNGPYLISEWSPTGGWESETTTWQAPIENTSTKKADQFYEYYSKYMPKNDPRFMGSMVFYWGNRQEYTHTWYSIFNEEGTPTEVEEVLNDCWKDTSTKHQAVKIKYTLVDSLGGNDNIILSPGSQHIATLVLQEGQPADSLKYYWEILKEDWIYWGRTWNNFKKPAAVKGLLTDSSKKNTFFTAPLKEGPYRIFITAYNNKGYCATANTPFYVAE